MAMPLSKIPRTPHPHTIRTRPIRGILITVHNIPSSPRTRTKEDGDLEAARFRPSCLGYRALSSWPDRQVIEDERELSLLHLPIPHHLVATGLYSFTSRPFLVLISLVLLFFKMVGSRSSSKSKLYLTVGGLAALSYFMHVRGPNDYLPTLRFPPSCYLMIAH